MATSSFHNSRGKVVRQSFSNCIRYTASASIGSYSIDPTTTGLFGNSLRNMAALYQECRCVGICLQILPNLAVDFASTPTGALATTVVFGHSPLRGSTPASFSEICQLSNCTALSSGQTVKSVLRLSRRDLVDPLPVKWVHFDGSPSTDTDSQGRIWTSAIGSESSTYVVSILVKSTWEFRSPQPFDLFMKIARAVVSREEKVPLDSEALPPPAVDCDSKEEFVCVEDTRPRASALPGKQSLCSSVPMGSAKNCRSRPS